MLLFYFKAQKEDCFFGGVKIYNTLLMHLKKEKFYLLFKEGHKEIVID